MIKIKVRDAGKGNDRYTVMITYKNGKDIVTDFYGMSYYPNHPLGFNQYCGSTMNGYEDGKHLGKLVDYSSLHEELQKAIRNRI